MFSAATKGTTAKTEEEKSDIAASTATTAETASDASTTAASEMSIEASTEASSIESLEDFKDVIVTVNYVDTHDKQIAESKELSITDTFDIKKDAKNFEGYFSDANRIAIVIEDVIYNMNKQIAIAFRHSDSYRDASDETLECGARKITHEFFEKLPKIREYLDTDVQACYTGDPAAYSKEEIILSYPGLFATSINRIAHELYLLKVPLIPRMMTEYAHSKTGIDIHPGATIGKYFMIDHGTGIVIGETSIIGEHVKMYQGVTIGGLSTRGGQALKGVKRHPTIENDVTIYAGASILGGDTIIGEGSVIELWLKNLNLMRVIL